MRRGRGRNWASAVILGCVAMVALPVRTPAGPEPDDPKGTSASERKAAIEKRRKAAAERAGKRAAERAEKRAADKGPTSRPSARRGTALLIDKIYAMVMDTKPAKKHIARIDAFFDETRLKVATIERTQRKDRSWMKGRIEQELDVLVHQVGEVLTADQFKQLLKAWTDHKENIPSARRKRTGAAPAR
jgi:hypothetical protein